MKLIILSIVSTLFSCCLSKSVEGNGLNRVSTKLYPYSLFDGFVHRGQKNALDKPLHMERVVDDQAVMYLLGENDMARGLFLNFLNVARAEQQIKAIIIVKDAMAKELIEGLLRADKHPESLNAVLVATHEHLKTFIDKFDDMGDKLEIKALMIVKDDEGKKIVDDLLLKNKMDNEIKIVLVGKEEQANNIIREFLINHSKAKELKSAIVSKGEDAGTKIDDLLTTGEEKEEIKIVLVGRGDKTKEMISKLLSTRKVVPAKVEPEINNAQHAVFIPMEAEKEKEKVEVVLIDKFGFDNLGVKGNYPKAFEAKEVNEYFFSKHSKARDINEGLLYHGSKPETCNTPKNETMKAGENLRIFFNLLKDFILDAYFDYEEFEVMGPELNTQFLKISTSIEEVADCESDLVTELTFVRRFYEEMVEAVELLKFYAASTIPGHRLVYSLIDLNIRLFGLRNIKGESDLRPKGFSTKVTRGIQILNFSTTEFRKLKSVPFGMLMMFNKNAVRAESNLIRLGQAAVSEPPRFE